MNASKRSSPDGDRRTLPSPSPATWREAADETAFLEREHRQARTGMRRNVRNLRRSSADVVRAHPFATAAIAAGISALLGVALYHKARRAQPRQERAEPLPCKRPSLLGRAARWVAGLAWNAAFVPLAAAAASPDEDQQV